MDLREIQPGMSLSGVEPGLVVSTIAVQLFSADSGTLVYRRPDGSITERLLNAAQLAEIQVATVERPWSFSGDGAALQLAIEAKRIDLAFLFDPMMAVHTSDVDPLPHQITAVYESLLPRQPLRFVLADDPGAGKTIMAGLYIRELLMRADARRIAIVAPGSLVEQWREELWRKFGLDFKIFSSAVDVASPTGNPFEDAAQLIVRLDQVSRSEDLRDKMAAAGWDLVVFDEAHKLSAHFFGQEIKKTQRFHLAETLGAATRHLLLMTATPHNGKEEDFQLFMSLLDSDRFYGKFRNGAHKVDVSDLMRRMVKEELVKFDGRPLFPERCAYTINYKLSEKEAELYEIVTTYVKDQMGRADQLSGKRKGAVGFALTLLQRRLASSPAAIWRSLERRQTRLEKRLQELRALGRANEALAQFAAAEELPEDEDDLDAQEQESLEETILDEATAAQTLVDLEKEVHVLKALTIKARHLAESHQDRKWDELSKILQHDSRLQDGSGKLRKLIVFTEHRDTLSYLAKKISDTLGSPAAVVTIHGGTPREERLKVQALFRDDPQVRVMVATDAAGEGVNLQNANLMVNYDLPWNPNRLEQRFGRIHRIGQEEVCHLWNLVANETREGEVYHRLLQKLEVEGKALQGRVFDILGEVFEEKSLKNLLLEAIRYGDLPETKARLQKQVDHAFDPARIEELLNRNALAEETMSRERLFAVKEQMEKAEARKLQPFFIRSFFLKAFETLGGSIHPREAGRYQITNVPSLLRERDRVLSGRNRRDPLPVVQRYERVCFQREDLQPAGKTNQTRAALIHPGHPLMMAVTDVVLERHGNLMRQGAVLVDPADEGLEPSLLFLITHEVLSGGDQVISRQLQFVRVSPSGEARFAGHAPHLDLLPLDPADWARLKEVLKAPWIQADLEQRALSLAAATLAREHFDEVSTRRIASVDKTLNAVHERLSGEIAHWTDRWMKLKDDLAAGKGERVNVDNAHRRVMDLQGRLENRKKELLAMRHVSAAAPVALGGALVVPQGLLRKLRGEAAEATLSADAQARSRIERLAMDAVRRHQEARGCTVIDVSAEKCGWDLTSVPPETDGTAPQPLHLEVKGRVKGADTITVTRNEILYAMNQAEKFRLAIVLVGEDDAVQGPFYVRKPFQQEPSWGVSSINYKLDALLAQAENL